MPDGRVANWIISSHDEKRIMSRKCLLFLITLHHSKFHNNFRVSGPIFRVICHGKPQIFEKFEFLEKN